MEEVILKKGFSHYKNNTISDIDICNFVGLETYKVLYKLYPKLYVRITHPMLVEDDRVNKFLTMASNYDNLSGKDIKRRLVRYYINKDYNKNNPDLVSRLINSSEPMNIVGITPLGFWLWTLWMFIMMILTVIVLVIYVYPQTISQNMEYYDIKCMTYC